MTAIPDSGPWRNIAASLSARAESMPRAVAVYEPYGWRRGGRTRYREITFRHLEDLSRAYAAQLAAAGVRPGTRTALMVPPSIGFFAVVFALFRLGAVPIFIDPGMGLRPLARCLDEAQPVAFVGGFKAHAARILFGWRRRNWQILAHFGGVSRIFSRLSLTPGNSARRDKNGTVENAAMHEPAANETAAVLFTSGSTGAPKGAIYQHSHFLTQIALLREIFGIAPGERDLCTFPLFALFAPALGMTSIIPRMDFTRPAKIDPREIFGPVARFNATNLFGSPALLRRVARYGEVHGLTLPTIKRALSAGAPVHHTTLTAFRALLGPDAEVYTPYGATEALPIAVASSAELLGDSQLGAGRGICVGKPAPRTSVRIMRITDASPSVWRQDLAAVLGETGEIVVGGAQVTAAYDQRQEATSAAKLRDPADGSVLHRMGDLGYLDTEGRLWFCGRKTHRVETKQGDLYTVPCEGIFNRHPRVYRTALVGKGRRGAMEPVLCVETEDPLRPSEKSRLKAELLELGAAHPTTRTIREIRFLKELPVDTRHNAKIFREKLKVLVDGETGGPQ